MDMSLVVELDVTLNGKNYVFKIPHGAPLGECHDACLAFLNKIVDMAKENVAKIQPAQAVVPAQDSNA